MLVIVFVRKAVPQAVVRWINGNTPHLPTVARLQKVERLEVFTMHQQGVSFGVQIGHIVQTGKKSIFKRLLKVHRVQHQRRVGSQELGCQWLAVALCPGQITLDFINGKQFHPFLPLAAGLAVPALYWQFSLFTNLGVEGLGYFIERD